MTQITRRFLIVDDDTLNNYITKILLKKSFEGVHVNDFTNPENGLDFMKSEPSHHPPEAKTILLLDINMPVLSGWEYLDAFELLDGSIKDQYEIYILSSSVDPGDVQRAKNHPLVKDFMEKPLNKEVLVKRFG